MRLKRKLRKKPRKSRRLRTPRTLASRPRKQQGQLTSLRLTLLMRNLLGLRLPKNSSNSSHRLSCASLTTRSSEFRNSSLKKVKNRRKVRKLLLLQSSLLKAKMLLLKSQRSLRKVRLFTETE